MSVKMRAKRRRTMRPYTPLPKYWIVVDRFLCSIGSRLGKMNLGLSGVSNEILPLNYVETYLEMETVQ